MNEEIKVLDLFSGIGGFSLGLEWASPAFRTVAFCERDPFAQRVLKKHWPEVPIYDDVKTIPTDGFGRIDMVTGGFPCQPASVSGARKGREDDRWLWSEIIRIVRGTQPTWLLLENVRGLLSLEGGMVFEDCIVDLEAAGYESETFIIPACAVDSAPHRRDRVWIVAHTQRQRFKHGQHERRSRCEARVSERRGENVADTKCVGWSEGAEVRKTSKGKGWTDKSCNSSSSKSEAIANTKSKRIQRHWASGEQEPQAYAGKKVSVCDSERPKPAFWLSESSICRVANGVSRRLDEAGRHLGWENGEPEGMQRVSIGIKDRANRLKTLGNAVVPQVVEQIGRAILEGWSHKPGNKINE